MKALVFLLILFNLLFYAFTQGYFGQAEHPDAGRIEKQVLAVAVKAHLESRITVYRDRTIVFD